MQKLSTICSKASKFLETHKWTKGAYSRDQNGNEVSIDSKKAVSWCVYGAICKVSGEILMSEKDLDDSYKRVVRIHGKKIGEDASYYNDFIAKDKRYIVRLLRRMAKDLKSRGL